MSTGPTTCDRYPQRCHLSTIGQNDALKSATFGATSTRVHGLEA